MAEKFNLKDYVEVKDRVAAFWVDFPTGRIVTEIVDFDKDLQSVLIKAFIYRSQDDAEPCATGHAHELKSEGYVNKTSFIENCETSAIGRALAVLGYAITKSIASREEMEKVERYNTDRPQTVSGMINPAQITALENLLKQKGIGITTLLQKYSDRAKELQELTFEQASQAIKWLGSL